MTKEREALKLALEALESLVESHGYTSYISDEEKEAEGEVMFARSTITAIKEALVQPEQEIIEDLQAKLKWTTEQLDANINWEFVASAKEAMLKAAWAEIKEMREQTKELREQEPVAKVMFVDGLKTNNLLDCDLPVGTQLYTTPPQRTWVGLTDEEFNEISSKHSVATIKAFVQEIELKLKEKNT